MSLKAKFVYHHGIPWVAIMVNKRVQNVVLGCNLKNDRMISVCFQGKPFNITVIQVYAPTSNAEETEVEWFYEDLRDLLELTPKKRCPFHYRGLECKSRKSRDTWSNREIWPWSTKWSRSKANRILPSEHTGHSKHSLYTLFNFWIKNDSSCMLRWFHISFAPPEILRWVAKLTLCF